VTIALLPATALTIGLMHLSTANAADGCSQRGCHHLMVKAPEGVNALTIIDGTLADGTSQGLACYPLPEHANGQWISTGLDLKDNTLLSISLEVGRYSNQPCFELLTRIASWSGTVPGADALDNM
jgi:hypothetical protein